MWTAFSYLGQDEMVMEMPFFYINDICSLTISYIHAYNVFGLNSCLFVLVCFLLCDPLSLTSFVWVTTGVKHSIRAWWADQEEHNGRQ